MKDRDRFEFALVIAPGQTDELVRELTDFFSSRRLCCKQISSVCHKKVLGISITYHEMDIIADHLGLLKLTKKDQITNKARLECFSLAKATTFEACALTLLFSSLINGGNNAPFRFFV